MNKHFYFLLFLIILCTGFMEAGFPTLGAGFGFCAFLSSMMLLIKGGD